MNKVEIFAIISKHCHDVLGDLDGHILEYGDSLRDFGASSMDRAEVVGLTLESIDLDIPRIKLLGVSNLGELVELLYAEQ